MTVVNIKGTARITKMGKVMIGEIMYSKGKELIGASILLNRELKTRTFVQMFLLIQGTEVMLKGILLLSDPSLTPEKLRRRYGHEIVKLVKVTSKSFGFKNIDLNFLKAIEDSDSYVQMKYSGLRDIFHDPNSYEVDIIYRKVTQAIKSFEKKVVPNFSK